MERTGSGGAVFRLVMQPYSAGNASLAVPELSVVQGSGGALGFAGRVLASGPLPGGSAQGLSLPINGRWVPGGALTLWRDCVDIAFDRLQIAQLSLERRGLRLGHGVWDLVFRRRGDSDGGAAPDTPQR